PVFSCSKIEQKQLNTWVSFQSAEQPLLGQFSVSGNTTEYRKPLLYTLYIQLEPLHFHPPIYATVGCHPETCELECARCGQSHDRV
ncbi:hypothetical protein MX624_30120, partial [Pseudomonas aeruginosa]|uniref:hypothetical protein n=1 Tax=Pseudomonas aeruginosa TaxID=287 RepID=UPI001FF8CF60